MRQSFLFPMAVFLVSVGTANADVKLDLKYSTYDVRGLTPSEIHADIDRHDARDGDGVIEGSADDDIKWTLDLEDANGSCRVRSNEVALSVEIVLPKWIDEASAAEAVKAIWAGYFTQLKAHEERHKDIALATAERIDALLKTAQAAGPCDPFREALNTQAKQALADEEAEQNKLEQTDLLIELE